MLTYLYCVRRDVIPVPSGLTGIDDASVRDVAAAGLMAWVSDVSTPPSATVEHLRAHDAVCAVALDGGDTPLPIRFGQTFADDAALVSAIASRAASLASRLTRVSGCVELRVVVAQGRDGPTNDEPGNATEATMSGVESVDPPGPGTAFLQRLARAGRADLAREVGCEEVRHAVRTAVKSLVVDQQRCESARGVSFFPVLVRRTNVDAFRTALGETLSPQAISLSVLGPFAPYSFAGDA